MGHIRELKKDIRDYFHQQEKDSERHIIYDDESNRYTELVRLPECLHTKEDATVYFEENEVLRCMVNVLAILSPASTRLSLDKMRCECIIVYLMMCSPKAGMKNSNHDSAGRLGGNSSWLERLEGLC